MNLIVKIKMLALNMKLNGMTGRNALKLNKSLENYCKVEDQSELITKTTSYKI
jgi:Xaa-Pro dipeptidase